MRPCSVASPARHFAAGFAWTGVLLLLLGTFFVLVGASLITRAWRTSEVPRQITAHEVQRLSAEQGDDAFANSNLQITEAQPLWDQLWTSEHRRKRSSIRMLYLPMAAAGTQTPAFILRLTPEQAAELERTVPAAYQGMRMSLLDPVVQEREPAQERFGPDLFTKLSVISYQEEAGRWSGAAGGLANLAFGIGFGVAGVLRLRRN